MRLHTHTDTMWWCKGAQRAQVQQQWRQQCERLALYRAQLQQEAAAVTQVAGSLQACWQQQAQQQQKAALASAGRPAVATTPPSHWGEGVVMRK